jgi:hypothetical protein
VTVGGWSRFDAALALAGVCLSGSLALSCASPAPSADRPASLAAPPAPSESAATASEESARAAAPHRGAAPGSDPGPADLDPRPALSSARPGVASLHAELVRRRGGEWVIVSLTPRERVQGDRESTRALAEAAGPFASDEHPELRAALREYERAFERRDAERLALVWIMNPYERVQLRQLFDKSAAIAVSIEDTALVVEGDRASLEFDQRIAISTRPPPARAFGRASQRVLVAHDAQGNWGLDQILGRN